MVPFYLKKGSKGGQNYEILQIWKVNRIVLSKFDAVSFFDWKLLVIWSQLFSISSGFQDKLYGKSEQVPNSKIRTFFFFNLMLMLFIRKMLLFIWVTLESITENELLWFYRKWLNVSQILKFHLHGRWTQSQVTILNSLFLRMIFLLHGFYNWIIKDL